MPAKDLGTKFLCYKCSTKFYDLRKPDPVCPKCGADQRESPVGKPTEPRKSRLASVPKPPEPVAEVAEEAAEEEAEDFPADEEIAAEEEP